MAGLHAITRKHTHTFSATYGAHSWEKKAHMGREGKYGEQKNMKVGIVGRGEKLKEKKLRG